MEKNWAGTTYGNKWMHKWLIRGLRYIDVRILYGFTAIFVIPVCLILNPSYGIIYRYFRERFKYSPLKAFWNTYVNHCLFGQIVIDKFAMYAGKKFPVDIVGYEHFLDLSKQEKGFIQLSSHIGNYEIAGYTLTAKEKVFNALVFGQEKESVMQNRNQMFSETNIRMIPVMEDMSHLFAIDNALNNGEIVSMPADRVFGSPKALTIDFLGAPAKFPMGPFSVATMRGLDVLAVNVMKTSLTRYKIFVTPLPYNKQATRKEQIREISEAYVRELEKTVKVFPTQWYNFFDFWVK